MVSGYAAAIIGRLEHIPVTFVAAIAIGLAENYIPTTSSPTSLGAPPTYHAAVPMAFLFAALVTLPSVRLRAVGRLTRCGRRGWRAGGSRWSPAGCSSRSPWWPPWSSPTNWKGITYLALGSEVMAFGIIGLSLVLLTGYSGQVSLCQFTFMGIGAFVMGKVAGGGSLLGLLAATAICAAIGALIAWPTVRLSDLYLALATFAFADAVFYGFFSDGRVYGSGGVNIGRIVLPGLSLGERRLSS